MNTNVTSLERLHDIILPAPVPWWPPAPGWYWILGFLAIAASLFAFRTFVRWQQNRYRREALAELARCEHALKNPALRTESIINIAELLKRAALSAWPREHVASLTGPPWFKFLDDTGRTSFTRGNGALLEQAAFDPHSVAALDQTELDELVSTTRKWLKQHRAKHASGGGV